MCIPGLPILKAYKKPGETDQYGAFPEPQRLSEIGNGHRQILTDGSFNSLF